MDASLYTPHQRRVLGIGIEADSVGGFKGARRDPVQEQKVVAPGGRPLVAREPPPRRRKPNRKASAGMLDKGKFVDVRPEGDDRSR